MMDGVVPPAFRAAYDDLLPALELGKSYWVSRLNAELQELRPVVIQTRIKEPVSIYSKIQKGDYASLFDIEDLIACRAVFLHPAVVKDALSLVSSVFPVVEERNVAVGKPVEFSYNQPHLIIRFPQEYVERNSRLANILTEIQFPTYIQHALQESVHDVTYKGSRFSWNEHRLDGRLRGLLEIVDDVLENVSSTASTGVDPEYELFDKRNRLIEIFKKTWPNGQLPTDMRRFVLSTETLLACAKVNPEEFATMLENNPDVVQALSLNVADKVLGVLLRERFDDLVKGLKSRRIYVPDELAVFVANIDKFPADKKFKLIES